MAKKKQIPGLAALKFKPNMDWDKSRAETMYKLMSEGPSLLRDQIFYEDCIEGMRRIGNETVDLVVADPPFGINFDGKGALYNRREENVIHGYLDVKSDYYEFSYLWLDQVKRLMKPTAAAYVFSGWTNLKQLLMAIDDLGFDVINHLIWKYNFGVFTKKKYVSSHYHILYIAKNANDVYYNKIEHYPEDVWMIPREYTPNKQKNGTKLPLSVVRKCINFSSKPGDLLFDPFMGNATTAVAAKYEFRHFFGFEINQTIQPFHFDELDGLRPGLLYRPYYDRLTPFFQATKKKYPYAWKIYQEELKKGEF